MSFRPINSSVSTKPAAASTGKAGKAGKSTTELPPPLTPEQTAFLDDAFPLKQHVGLRNKIRNLIGQNPSTNLAILKSVCEYITTLQRDIQTLQSQNKEKDGVISSLQQQRNGGAGQGGEVGEVVMMDVDAESGSSGGTGKKRKIEDVSAANGGVGVGGGGGGGGGSGGEVGGEVLLTVTDLSFTIPQRKKFTVVVTTEGLMAVQAGKVEWGVKWRDIKTIILLPVPEKATRQHNFVIFPLGSEGIDPSPSQGTVAPEPAVFTIPDTAPKTASGPYLTSPTFPANAGESYRTLLTTILNAHSPNTITIPTQSEFTSVIPQPHRKGEVAFHVKAHRGSKDGYLWFLPEGILWGFKKPLWYAEFHRIESVSYTSITKRTFNLAITVHDPNATQDEETEGQQQGKGKSGKGSGGGEEVEFAMIDQADYTGIDMYIKKHRLNDASLAEMRRAVYYNVNKPPRDGDDDTAAAAGDGGQHASSQPTMSELEKALEDAEDEEEEDYDPEAEEGGESDGSGSGTDDDQEDSDEEEEEDDEGSDDGEEEASGNARGNVDLKEELGSELEEVTPSDDQDMGGVAKKVVARRRGRGGR